MENTAVGSEIGILKSPFYVQLLSGMHLKFNRYRYYSRDLHNLQWFCLRILGNISVNKTRNQSFWSANNWGATLQISTAATVVIMVSGSM